MLEHCHLLSFIASGFFIGAFSFFWVNKFTSSDTPIVGWLAGSLGWVSFWLSNNAQSRAARIADFCLEKLLFVLTECEYCFAAQFALWTGIFYHHLDWYHVLMLMGISMLSAGLCNRWIKNTL